MPTNSAVHTAHKIQTAQHDRPYVGTGELAQIIDDELRLADVVAALRRSDQLLEQQGVSIEQRDFVIKALARLEGPTSTPIADAVIGTTP